MTSTAEKSSTWSNLVVRVKWGLMLAIAAFAVTWWGGLAFTIFFGVASLQIYREWVTIVGEDALGIPAMVGYGAILGLVVCLWFGAWQAALVLPVVGAGFLYFARCSYSHARWCASGLIYAAAFAFSILLLRADPDNGFSAILILFAVVWGTDVAAYFTGKTLKGPKLWPAVSPKKTWSGSLGGLVIGAGLALVVAWFLGIEPTIKLALLLAGLSVASQAGDLGESSLKRMFDVKDSSNLIPGHGGVMDRADGLLVAVVCAALIGALFADVNHLATGFLVW